MHKKLETRTFLWSLLLVSAAFLWVLKPFLGPIFWACVIALIFQPAQGALLARIPQRPNLAALLTIVLCLIIVVIPVIFLISSIVNEFALLYGKIQSGELDLNSYIEKIRSAFPTAQPLLERLGLDLSTLSAQLVKAIQASGGFIAQHAINIGQNTFGVIIDTGLMLYLAFFLLRDGHKIVDLLIRALPMGDTRERLLFKKFAEVTRATVKGNLVVAIVQGTLGGFIFAVLGISGAFLWGVVMVILSLVPLVGAGMIWVPVTIYLFAIGAYIKAVILLIFGITVIGLVDNILRPILVGRDTKLPDYMVLLSTLGGLSLFGINGFVMGPLVAALFMAFWEIFIREFQSQQ